MTFQLQELNLDSDTITLDPTHYDITVSDVEIVATHKKTGKVLTYAVAGAGTAATVSLVAATPARADVAGVEAMVNSLGGLAATAFAVAIIPVGIYFAVRIVKRVMNA